MRVEIRTTPFDPWSELAAWTSPVGDSGAGDSGAADAGATAVFVGTTRDWQEGVDAFAEKRTPIFKGE